MRGKFVSKDYIGHLPICNKCKHRIIGIECKAFDVIPDEILGGDNNHSKPLPDQKNNIVFEPKE